MSNTPKNSLALIKDWLSEKPRTMGWDAILAYDRVKANELLMQEYIETFNNEGGYLKPITTDIPDTSPFEYFNGVVLASPVLSFENSTITQSVAKLTFELVGGTHVTLSQPSGSLVKRVSQISEFSPLSGSKIWVDINLAFAPGQVQGEGTVQLDLNATLSKEWHSSLGATEKNRRVVAEYFYSLFGELDPQYKVYVLNKFKPNSSTLLSPESFIVRVHPKSGSALVALQGAEVDEKDGQILLFVTMKDGENGTIPATDSDLPYLIPDETDGYSATMLLGAKFMYEKVLAGSIKYFNTWDKNPPSFEISYGDDQVVKEVVAVGGLTFRQMPVQTIDGNSVSFWSVGPALGRSSDPGENFAEFTIRPNVELGGGDLEGGIDLVWRGKGGTVGWVSLGELQYYCMFNYSWDIAFPAAFVKENNSLKLVMFPEATKTSAPNYARIDELDIPKWSDPIYDERKKIYVSTTSPCWTIYFRA